jgi:hypothetical protein
MIYPPVTYSITVNYTAHIPDGGGEKAGLNRWIAAKKLAPGMAVAGLCLGAVRIIAGIVINYKIWKEFDEFDDYMLKKYFSK